MKSTLKSSASKSSASTPSIPKPGTKTAGANRAGSVHSSAASNYPTTPAKTAHAQESTDATRRSGRGEPPLVSLGKPRQVYSRNNISIRRIRELHQRAERQRTGLFFVTGLRFLIQASQQGAKIETLVVAPALLTSIPGQRLVRKLRRQGTSCLEVPAEVLHSISLSDDPQGVGAVIRQRWEPLPPVTPGRELCWLALDSVQSPGNLGTILRSCDAVGCAGVILLSDSSDPYDPAAVRASMGALFAQRFIRCTLAEFLAWKQTQGCLLVGTSPHAGEDYQQVTYPSPTVLFMGSERKGLPPEFQALCDRMVRIPMVGTSDSLNLAIATSVMLYEVFNQRRKT